MFSPGQLTFAGIFCIVFTILTIWSYRKDLKLHQKYYKNTAWKIIVVLFIFVAMLFGLKKILY